MTSLVSAVIIAFGSLPVLWVSRRSLLRPSSYGFFRFFAVEAILVLIVLNAPNWFAQPFALRQLASWFLFLAAVLTVISGSLTLRRRRKDQGGLVTSGPYRYIRHPLYAALLLLGWSAFLKDVCPPTLGLIAVATAALVATAKAEEAENLRRFGHVYRDYTARTHLFVPFVF